MIKLEIGNTVYSWAAIDGMAEAFDFIVSSDWTMVLKFDPDIGVYCIVSGGGEVEDKSFYELKFVHPEKSLDFDLSKLPSHECVVIDQNTQIMTVKESFYLMLKEAFER